MTRNNPKIQIDSKHIPSGWVNGLVENNEIGGVFLVFLSGKTRSEINKKIKIIESACRDIRKIK